MCEILCLEKCISTKLKLRTCVFSPSEEWVFLAYSKSWSCLPSNGFRLSNLNTLSFGHLRHRAREGWKKMKEVIGIQRRVHRIRSHRIPKKESERSRAVSRSQDIRLLLDSVASFSTPGSGTETRRAPLWVEALSELFFHVLSVKSFRVRFRVLSTCISATCCHVLSLGFRNPAMLFAFKHYDALKKEGLQEERCIALPAYCKGEIWRGVSWGVSSCEEFPYVSIILFQLLSRFSYDSHAS